MTENVVINIVENVNVICFRVPFTGKRIVIHELITPVL